jgi:hypothetical protein
MRECYLKHGTGMRYDFHSWVTRVSYPVIRKFHFRDYETFISGNIRVSYPEIEIQPSGNVIFGNAEMEPLISEDMGGSTLVAQCWQDFY